MKGSVLYFMHSDEINIPSLYDYNYVCNAVSVPIDAYNIRWSCSYCADLSP